MHVRATRLWDALVEAGDGCCEIHTAFLALLLAFGLKVCVQGVLALLAKSAWPEQQNVGDVQASWRFCQSSDSAERL